MEPMKIARSSDGMPLVFAPRMRRDGAAPLIGSSAVMGAVRDRIERVAATDSSRSSTVRAAPAKSWWRGRFTRSAPAGAGRSCRSIARRSSRRCSRPSSSVSKIVRRPAYADAVGNSNARMAARCFSTRSPTCRSRRRRSCCGRSRTWRSRGSEAMGCFGSTRGWWPDKT